MDLTPTYNTISFGVTILPRAEEMAKGGGVKFPKVHKIAAMVRLAARVRVKNPKSRKIQKCFRRRPKSTGFNRARADDSYKEERIQLAVAREN